MKGFTLIEALTVLVVFGIICLIGIPIAKNVLSRSSDSLYDTQVKLIEDTVEEMTIDDRSMLGKVSCINLEDVIKSGYLDQKQIIDPRNNEAMDGSVNITYDAEYDDYSFKYQETRCS